MLSIRYISLSRSLLSYTRSLQAHFRLIKSTEDKLTIVRLFHVQNHEGIGGCRMGKSEF